MLSESIVDQQVCEAIATNLMLFDSEKEKNKRLEMTEKLVKKIVDNTITMSGKLFDSLVFVFTESQQWRLLTDLLAQANAGKRCEPDQKTVNYLKKNLLYCFEPQTRALLKEQIERLEDNFVGHMKATAAA